MKIYLLFILLIVVCSCKQHVAEIFNNVTSDSIMSNTKIMTIDNSDVINIEVQIKDKSYVLCPLEFLVDSIRMLKLETTDESIIGNISKLQISDSAYFISDRFQTRLIKVFDKNGHYLRNIGSIGNGPYEYVQPTDFAITNDKVFVLDQFQHKMISYKHNGTPIREYSLPFFCMELAVLDDNTFVFRDINADNYHLPELLDYSLWICDSTMQIKKMGCYMKHGQYLSFLSDKLRQSNGKYYFNDIANDTIFSITKDGNLKTEYVLDFKDKRNKEFYKNYDEYKEHTKKGDFYDFHEYMICDSILYYDFTAYGIAYYTYFYVNENTFSYFNTTSPAIDKISKIQGINNPSLAYKDGFLIFSVPADFIQDSYKEINKDNIFEEQAKNGEYLYYKEEKELIESIKIEDNPILMFYRLKTDFD